MEHLVKQPIARKLKRLWKNKDLRPSTSADLYSVLFRPDDYLKHLLRQDPGKIQYRSLCFWIEDELKKVGKGGTIVLSEGVASLRGRDCDVVASALLPAWVRRFLDLTGLENHSAYRYQHILTYVLGVDLVNPFVVPSDTRRVLIPQFAGHLYDDCRVTTSQDGRQLCVVDLVELEAIEGTMAYRGIGKTELPFVLPQGIEVHRGFSACRRSVIQEAWFVESSHVELVFNEDQTLVLPLIDFTNPNRGFVEIKDMPVYERAPY